MPRWLWLLMYGCVAWPAYKPTPKALSLKFSQKLPAYTRVYTVHRDRQTDTQTRHRHLLLTWINCELTSDNNEQHTYTPLVVGDTRHITWHRNGHWYSLSAKASGQEIPWHRHGHCNSSVYNSHCSVPPERNNEIFSKLRNPLKYPIPYSRTKKYQSFLNYALANFQNSM